MCIRDRISSACKSKTSAPKPDRKIGFIFGAGNRGRTDTMLPSRDFKSLASACSAIPAQIYRNSISRAKTFVNCRRGLKNKIKNKKSLQSRTLLLEAPPRLELGSRGFADLCLTTWLWRLYLERETGFGPATFALARQRSTTEPLPRIVSLNILTKTIKKIKRFVSIY